MPARRISHRLCPILRLPNIIEELREAYLVEHQYDVVLAPMLTHIGAKVVADDIGVAIVPLRIGQDSLHRR